jgi:hypothetical protein
MVNYSNGKIYKIEALNAPIDEKVYVGSTTKQYLSQRMDKHRSDYKNWKEGNAKYFKLTSFELFDKYGVENCMIVLIEAVNATTKDELHAREAYHIKALNSINKILPIMTDEEKKSTKHDYYVVNRDKIKEYQSINSEKLKATRKLRDEKNSEKLKYETKMYKDAHKEELKVKRKEYVCANEDKIKSDWKIYYELNKEKLKEKRREYYRLQKENKN